MVYLFCTNHRDREKISILLQTFKKGFLVWKLLYYDSNFPDISFHWFQLRITQHWFRKLPGVEQVTSHYLNNNDVVYWRIYFSFSRGTEYPIYILLYCCDVYHCCFLWIFMVQGQCYFACHHGHQTALKFIIISSSNCCVQYLLVLSVGEVRGNIFIYNWLIITEE